MRVFSAGKFLFGAVVTGVLFPVATQAKTCLMLYQMADNNLEYYIRQDYNELATSQVISSSDLRTWVYYVSSNLSGVD